MFKCCSISLAMGIEVTPELQAKLGIKTTELAVTKLPPQRPVYGTVLSPAALIDLYRQIEVAQAAVNVSKDSLARAEKLFADGELVARKEVEAARAQHVQNVAAIQTLDDHQMLEWGRHFSTLASNDRTHLIESLLTGKSVMIRLALPHGISLEDAPLAARLHTFGHGKTPFRCTTILPSPMIDPAFQAQTFLSIQETKNAALIVGSTVSGVLELSGEPHEGLLVPQDAVIFYLGKSWIYQNSKDNEFERVEIPTTEPIEGGWFVAKDAIESLKVVNIGAQSILSQETLAPEEPAAD